MDVSPFTYETSCSWIEYVSWTSNLSTDYKGIITTRYFLGGYSRVSVVARFIWTVASDEE